MRHNPNKENVDAAQLELERGGEGARKKARVLGAREDIVDALWKEVGEEVGVEGLGEGAMSPVKRGDVTAMEGALVVPRKRTNANHLITPKRAARRVALETLGASPVKGGLGGQLVRESPRKILLNDVVEEGVVEKPARRRKSMRKSTSRRLTRSSMEDESVLSAGSAATIVQMPEVAATMPEVEQVIPQSESVADEATVLNGASTLDSLKPVVQDVIVGSIEFPVEADPVEEVALPSETEVAFQKATLEDEPLEISSSLNQDNITEALEDHITDTFSADLDSQIPTSEVDSEEPQMASSSLEITEVTASTSNPAIVEVTDRLPESPIVEARFVAPKANDVLSKLSSSPKKAPATPRRGKKAMAPPQSARRSTRSKRTTSMLPDDSASNDIQTGHVPSPVKVAVEQSSDTQSLEVVALDELTELPEIAESLPMEEANSPVQEDEPIAEIACLTMVETGEEVVPTTEPGVDEDENEKFESLSPSTSLMHEIRDNFEDVDTTEDAELEPNHESIDRESSSLVQTESEDTTSTEVTLPKSVASNNREGSFEEEPEEFDSPSAQLLSEEETITQDLEVSVSGDTCLAIPFLQETSMVQSNLSMEAANNDAESDDASEEDLEEFEPVSIATVAGSMLDNVTMELDILAESSTPDPSTNALVEAISEKAPTAKYDEDNTDLLRNFLTRVKANKEAKAKSTTTKRKRSLPHSPIQVPLGSESVLSPSSPQSKIDFDVSLPARNASPAKRRKRGEPPTTTTTTDDTTESQSIRRSGRTRLPVKSLTNLPALSFIPVRRIGQDGDTTITLRKSDDKELAALTKINTRKNKGNAIPALDTITKLSTQKEDPAARHHALKQKFEEKNAKSKKKKNVVWAEEIAQYQTFESTDEKESVAGKEKEKEEVVVVVVGEKKEIAMAAKEKKERKEKKNGIPVRATISTTATSSSSSSEEAKKAPVKVGVRSSRIAMGMVANGTPAPKRKVKVRS